MQTVPMMRVTSSPHVKNSITTTTIMLNVIIALLPAGIFGVWHFGGNALMLILVSVTSAVLWEVLIQRALKRPVTITDLSAVVTGLLLAYNLPPTAPLWIAVVGTGIAIILVKQIFGGLGSNFMNPALAARAILLASWVGLMSGNAFIMPGDAGAAVDAVSSASVDAVSHATPLMAQTGTYGLWQMFWGDIPGCIGEVSKLFLLVGGIYLIAIRVISWRIPVSMMLTSFVLFWIYSGSALSGVGSALYQLLSGGLILGAFFMATDYSTSPATPLGKIIFGVGCGVLLFVIRAFNHSYPEGCSYAILIMNCASPLIEKLTKPRIYGRAKKHA